VGKGDPVLLKFGEIVGLTSTDTVQISVYECSTDECLDPGEPKKMTIKPFSAITRELINKMREGIVNHSEPSLTAEEKAALILASVPLYRLASLAQGTGIAAGVAVSLQNDFADYAALDAASNLVNYYLDELQRATAGPMTEWGKEFATVVTQINQNIVNVRQQINDELANYYAKKGNPWEKIEMLDKAERIMYSNLSIQLAANSRFGNNYFK
jgi:hypothetical protein